MLLLLKLQLPYFIAFFQVALLSDCWRELFLLSLVQWEVPFSPLALLDHDPGDLISAGEMPGPPAARLCAEIQHMKEILSRFKMLSIDPMEFTCLKAIVLFRPGEKTLST